MDVNLPAEDPGQRLIGAAVYRSQTAAVKLVWQHGVDPAALQQGRRDMVSAAVMCGTPELLQLLLDALVDQNIDALSKAGLICQAAGCRDPGLVKLLLERGPSIEEKAGASVSLLDKLSKKDDAQDGMRDIEGEGWIREQEKRLSGTKLTHERRDREPVDGQLDGWAG